MNKKLYILTLSLLCFFTFFVTSIFAATFVDDAQAEFDAGTYSDT